MAGHHAECDHFTAYRTIVIMIAEDDFVDLFFVIGAVKCELFDDFTEYDFALFSLCRNLGQSAVFEEARKNRFAVFFLGVDKFVLFFFSS